MERTKEEQWYSSNEGPPGQVHTTTISMLNKASNGREMLTDDWGDNIEKGDVSNDVILELENDDDDSSESEAEFQE